jgi:hypothetical protein
MDGRASRLYRTRLVLLKRLAQIALNSGSISLLLLVLGAWLAGVAAPAFLQLLLRSDTRIDPGRQILAGLGWITTSVYSYYRIYSVVDSTTSGIS